ncbi:hypothetical protein [Burkholderia gladioli]|uniref:hypothetical protein n=1 Tax=Burkholderia gladioli TaxID=28095 RepID=UPI0016408B0B|nr:hypothetical protein [Burkholderia gladioli]MBU9320108.1 hypothetical protein [Burkholderia gladioli]
MPMTSHRSKHVFSIIAGPVSFRFAQGWTQYIDAIVGILTRTVTSASNSAGCTPSCPKTALDEPARIGENPAIRVISTRYCVALAVAAGLNSPRPRGIARKPARQGFQPQPIAASPATAPGFPARPAQCAVLKSGHIENPDPSH